MKIEQVKKLSPTERFLYWVKERHNIYLRRKAGKPKPWTDDDVLRSFFFTNPYRENDRTTVWFRENVRDPLRDDPRVVMATVIFRWFNYIPTGKFLMGVKNVKPPKQRYGLLEDWDGKEALDHLGAYRDSGNKVFTGAFMINSPGGEPKLEAIVRRVTNVWDSRDEILDELKRGAFERKNSLQEAHELFMEFEGLAGFMAYEIVTDLRYTWVLRDAPDKLTWCNPGPGCVRGLRRMMELPLTTDLGCMMGPPEGWRELMGSLLGRLRRFRSMPEFEMREVEHSLCEWDKYERAVEGGKLKRRYPGGVSAQSSVV